MLPAYFVLLVLSWTYALHGSVPWIAAIFYGLRAAVIAIVAAAVIRIGSRALKSRTMVGIAAAAFVAIFFFKVPFPAIVISAGLLGLIGTRLRPETFAIPESHAPGSQATVIADLAPPAEYKIGRASCRERV